MRSKFSLSIIPTPLIVLIAGAALITAVVMLSPKPRPSPAATVVAIEVAVVIARPGSETLSVRSQGTVAPKRQIDLVAQVAGRIGSVAPNFVNGGFFNEGDVLASIEQADFELALVRAAGQVAQAEQELATAYGQARLAKREWRDLGNAEANALFLREPQTAASEANVAAAKAERDQAKLNLQRTRISVPFNGRIRETKVDLGQYVTPGTAVATVYDTSVAEIRLPITDRQLALLDLPLGFHNDQQGPAVTIHGTIAGTTYQWQGRITRTDASLDTRSRMYYAIAEVVDPFLIKPATVARPDNAQEPLVVGLFVDADINGRQLQDVMKLPRQVLFNRDQIYTVDSNNQVRLHQVQVLHTDDDYVWLQAAVADGTAVVLERQGFLTPGVAVAPIVAANDNLGTTTTNLPHNNLLQNNLPQNKQSNVPAEEH